MKAALAFVALLALVGEVGASHFRYGSMRWYATESQPNSNKMRVKLTLELAYRQTFYSGRNIPVGIGDTIDLGAYDDEINFGDDNKQDIDNFEITVSRTEAEGGGDGGVVMGISTNYHSYNINGNKMYTAVYQRCCRLDSLIGKTVSGDWRLAIVIDPHAPGHQSPTSSFVPVVEIGNLGTHHIDLVALPPVYDTDLVWSLPTYQEMGCTEYCQPGPPDKYYIDSETGHIKWKMNGEFPLGTYSTLVNVAGVVSPHIKVPIDFLIVVSEEQYLCVDECSNSGTTCSADTNAPCAGACMEEVYGDPGCHKNVHPQMNVPNDITQFIDTEVNFAVRFEPAFHYEHYQDLHITSGTMPIGSTFEWHDGPADTGYGRIILPAEINHIPAQYAMCFIADDGFIHGLPKCTRVSILRPPVPGVVAPAGVNGYVDELTEFSVHFDDDYKGDYHHLMWVVSDMPKDCIYFGSEDHDGHGYKGVVIISEDCSHQPLDFHVCFAADDSHQGEHEMGEETCTHVEIEPRPTIDCFGEFKTLEECGTEPLCYWDKDGKDKDFDEDGPTGCYDFHHCYSMDGTKNACKSHFLCHYGAFGECLMTHHDGMPLSEVNWDGDACRHFSKKMCRDVDDQGKHFEQDKHCEWDSINDWCVTPELHMPHVDMCRSIDTKSSCKKAIRNGKRCNWKRDEGPSHGPNASPGKCVGNRNPINGENRGDFLDVAKTQNERFSNREFSKHAAETHDNEHGLFVHKDMHYETHNEKYFMKDYDGVHAEAFELDFKK